MFSKMDVKFCDNIGSAQRPVKGVAHLAGTELSTRKRWISWNHFLLQNDLEQAGIERSGLRWSPYYGGDHD